MTGKPCYHNVGMRAIGSRIICEKVNINEARYGNLVVPVLGIGDHTVWKVVEVGPEVKEVKPGDYILAPVHVLQELHYAGRELAVVKEEHVYAILDEEELFA